MSNVLTLRGAPSRLFFDAPATTAIYTLSLHDALPIYLHVGVRKHDGSDVSSFHDHAAVDTEAPLTLDEQDRKSTRLNSSHRTTSYAVFCLKKKWRKESRRSAQARCI